jgi:hypothetical protein
MDARRLRSALLSGSLAVAGLTLMPALGSATPALAIGPYGTCTASPPSSTSPPSDRPCVQSPASAAESYLSPAPPELPGDSPYTYSGSSTYRATGYYYTY